MAQHQHHFSLHVESFVVVVRYSGAVTLAGENDRRLKVAVVRKTKRSVILAQRHCRARSALLYGEEVIRSQLRGNRHLEVLQVSSVVAARLQSIGTKIVG
jgi:hypothetical protein